MKKSTLWKRGLAFGLAAALIVATPAEPLLAAGVQITVNTEVSTEDAGAETTEKSEQSTEAPEKTEAAGTEAPEETEATEKETETQQPTEAEQQTETETAATEESEAPEATETEATEEETETQQPTETEQPAETEQPTEAETGEAERETDTEIPREELEIAMPLLEQGIELYAADGGSAADDFDLAVYQAERFLDSTSVSYKSIELYSQTEMPSKIMVKLLDADGCFQNSVKAWKAANIAVSPSEIAAGKLDEQGYYEAIIFSLFLTRTESDNYIYDTVDKAARETNKILSQIEKWVKETTELSAEFDIKNGKITDIPPDDVEKIKQYLSGVYEKKYPDLKNTGQIARGVADVFKFTDSVVDGVKMLTSYMQLAQMGTEMKAVLLEMYAQCPYGNATLKEALRDAAASMTDMETAFSVGALKATADMGYDVAKQVIDGWWTTLLNSNPYSKAFLNGAKLGIFISNTLFSTDKIIEQYEKMKCLGEVDAVVRLTIESLRKRFQSDKTTINAQSYIEAVFLMYKAGDISCDFALSYADVIYGDTVPGSLQVLCGDKTYEEYKRVVTSIKNYSAGFQKDLRQSYLYDLEYEYPEIYAALMKEKEEAGIVAVTGIEFPQDECTVWLGDAYHPFVNPVVAPFHATNSSVRYMSSDTSVLDISGPIVVLEPHKAGTVTVTATTEDGGFTDTITVHVVEGKSSESDENINAPDVIDKGQCGDNVWYMLFVDGTLVIDGEGEMWDYYRFEDDCFKGHDSEIKNVKIDEGITHIGDRIFCGCSNLVNIVIPNGVKSIGEAAFCGCNLTNVVIPNGVKSIGPGAFYACYNLTSIELPNGITRIESSTFSQCGLTSIKIPNEVTSIDMCAFEYCCSLTSIELPNNVTSIGWKAFYNCDNLTSIAIPKGVMNIGDKAFGGLTQMNLKIVHYAGSKEQWNKIAIGSGNSILYDAVIYYNSDGSCDHLTTEIHSAKFATCTKAGYTGDIYCKSCGEQIEKGRTTAALGHQYSGKVTKQPTVVREGVTTYSCTRCGNTYTKPIDRLTVKYTVSFHGNGNTGGSMENQTITYGSGAKLAANNFTKKNSRFIGWNTKKDGSGKKYGDKADASKLTKKNGADITLYAQWESTDNVTTYTITYKLNGGTNNKKNPKTYTISAKTIKLAAPTRKGYSFDGWYTDKKFKNRISSIKKGTKKNYTLYAKWTKVTVKATSFTTCKNSKKGQISLKYKKLSGVKGYEISYSTDKKFKKSVTKKTTQKTSYVMKKLKKGKTYYVRVRAYKLDSTGQKVYGKYSAIKRVKVKR